MDNERDSNPIVDPDGDPIEILQVAQHQKTATDFFIGQPKIPDG